MENLGTLKWMNESKAWEENGRIAMEASAKGDFFSFTAEDGTVTKVCTAPFLFREVEGDFVASVKVSGEFVLEYDSCVLLIYGSEDLWAKACLELTDFGSTAVVSVVNNAVSDDCNGCDLAQSSVWLKAARVGRKFSFHYSTDGTNYRMMRAFELPAAGTVRVGLAAQAPAGDGGMRYFEDFTIRSETVRDLRSGV